MIHSISVFCPLHLYSLSVPLIKTVLQPETYVSINDHIHLIPIVISNAPPSHLTSVSIQPRSLIKGRAALPLSQQACLIFCPLICIKKEGTYKLERV